MRRHNTSFFVFSLVLSLSLVAGSLFYGGKVKASSPIFYDSSFTFYVPDFSDSETNDRSDFTYRSLTLTQPNFGQTAQIYSNLGAVLGSNSTNAFSTLTNFRIAIKSRDLFANGGTIYLSYLFAYGSEIYGTNSNLENNLNYSSFGSAQVSLSAPGSLSISNTALAQSYISVSHSLVDLHNSSILTTEEYQNPANATVYGFNAFDGSNFPHGVGMLLRGSTSQLLDDYGLSGTKFWNYGLADNVWWRSSMHQIKLTISPMPEEYWDYAIILAAGGPQAGSNTFGSRSFQTTVTIGDQSENLTFAYSPLVYFCPVYNFVVSSEYYDSLQGILTDINSNLESALSDLGIIAAQPDSEQLVWLDNMARKASTAAGVASSLSTRSAYSFTKPVGYEFESQLVAPLRDQQALPLIQIINGFLSHTKILAILTLAVVASIIGYIFFGKRG